MAYKKSTETRRQILEAAAQLFREKGYYKTDMKEIAGRINMAHTALYYYFKNKESVADAIYDEAVRKLVAFMLEVDQQEKDTLTKLILQYILLLNVLAEDKATESVFFDMVHYDTYDKENLQRIRLEFYPLLERLLEERCITASDNLIHSFILTSDAYLKAMLRGAQGGHITWGRREILDRFFTQLLLRDLGISPEEYMKKKEKAFRLSCQLDPAILQRF